MTASLYQSGSDALPGRFIDSGDPVAQAQNMRGQTVRSQLHVIARSLPHVRGAAEQIVRRERLTRVEPERFEVQIHPSCLLIKRVQIDYGEDHVGKIAGRLAVADEHGIIGLVKSQITVSL